MFYLQKNALRILLPYQEYGIAKHQLSVFPETAKQDVVRKKGKAAITNRQYTKQ